MNDQITTTITNRLLGANYFIPLDITSGFHQILELPEYVEKTTFVTLHDTYLVLVKMQLPFRFLFCKKRG